MKVIETFNYDEEEQAIKLFSALRSCFRREYKVVLVTEPVFNNNTRWYFKIFVDTEIHDLAETFVHGWYYRQDMKKMKEAGRGFVARSYLEPVVIKECWRGVDDRPKEE